MQVMAVMDAIVSLASMILGMGCGYAIGALKDTGRWERIALGGLVSLIGGFIVSLIFGSYVMMRMPPIPLQIASFTVGTIVGGVWHWQTPIRQRSSPHIIFKPDDDEEFDRKIDEAFRRKE